MVASVNAAYLGEYLDRDSAMARVQAEIEHNMEMVLHDWGLYQTAKQKQSAELWRKLGARNSQRRPRRNGGAATIGCSRSCRTISPSS